jgi:flagellar hook-associated protein 3 FlgL
MQIGTASLLSSTLGRAMTDLRASFDDLTRQLSSGRVAETYGGLGSGRATALAMRAKMDEMAGFRSTIKDVNLRISTLSTTLTRLDTLASEQRSDTDPTDNTLIVDGQTRAQVDAKLRFEEALSLLSTDIAGSYIFGGRATSQPPVLTSGKILDGDGSKVGLKAVIAERRLADAGTIDRDGVGTDSVGRLTASASTGTAFTLAEDGTHAFGFKLQGGATTIPGATIAGPTGSPASLDVSLTSQPAPEQTVRLTMKLPDGTTDDIILKAATSATAGDGSQFAIGATLADTVANLRGAILSSLETRSATTLAAASSVVAAEGFFAAGPQTAPQRVAFTPPATAATATGLRDGSADTVTWYVGDDDPILSARGSSVARVDSGIAVSYGVRANEEGITKSVRTFALFAAEVYTSGDPNASARNFALSERVRDALQPDVGIGSLRAISTELSGAQRAAVAADDRLRISAASAQDLIDGVEKADDQSVAASLLAVQTRLQASYQTTSMLAKLTLVNFI